ARTAAAPRVQALLDSGEQPRQPPPDQKRDDEPQQPEDDHSPGPLGVPDGGPGFGGMLRSGCADRRPSRACLAASASSEPGATSRIFCHASAAPFMSCLPNARTIPMFSSVFACLGSISSDLSNCASARSGSFM